MPITTFHISLEFLSPAFMGGAHPEKQAEFSLKGLKGIMRYWWRMAQDWTNSTQMFEREKDLFGHTKRASPFSMRITDRSCLNTDRNVNGYLPNAPRSGRAYLFFSCRQQGRNQPGRKEWIRPGSLVKFSLRFSSDDTNLIQQVIFSLWLAQTFGGLGTRSRRGAGSFTISLDKVPGDWSFVEELFALTASQFREHINENTDKWYTNLVHPGSPLAVALQTPDHFKVSAAYSSTDQLLDEIGQRMRNYRAVFGGGGTTFRSDARNLHNYATSGQRVAYSGRDPLPKHAFGLPIIYNFRRRRGRGFEANHIEAVPDGYERRASPLFVSVKRDATGRYYANLLLLWHHFLPGSSGISLNVKRRGSSAPPVKSHRVGAPGNPNPIVTFIRSIP